MLFSQKILEILIKSVYYLFNENKISTEKGAFRVKGNIAKKLAKRKRKISKRLEKRNWSNQPRPMMSGRNICYDVDGRHQAIVSGGIGNVHQLALRTGLIAEIDKRLKLLKRHLPYHESDHVLNIAYNYLNGSSRLQDIELLRNDEAWLNALGAEIIPDPTTAGDFLRRFEKYDICELMEVKNTVRSRILTRPTGSIRAWIWFAATLRMCTCGEIPTLASPPTWTNGISAADLFSVWMRCPTC